MKSFIEYLFIKESTCDPLIRIENGELAGSNYTVGAELTVTCDRGYVIKGSATVTCQSNRDWTALPTCERKRVHCCC